MFNTINRLVVRSFELSCELYKNFINIIYTLKTNLTIYLEPIFTCAIEIVNLTNSVLFEDSFNEEYKMASLTNHDPQLATKGISILDDSDDAGVVLALRNVRDEGIKIANLPYDKIKKDSNTMKI